MIRSRALFLLGLALLVVSCATRYHEVAGWRALQPGVGLRVEKGQGPEGSPALSVLYTLVPGQSYAIERRLALERGNSQPSVSLLLRATRVLHLAVVLVDEQGTEHEAVRTLAAGDWHEVQFAGFFPPLEASAEVQALRLVDRTGALGGQGPVSLKLVDLTSER